MKILRGPWGKTQEHARIQRLFQDIIDAELGRELRKENDTEAEIRERVRRWKLKRWGKATLYLLFAWLGLK